MNARLSLSAVALAIAGATGCSSVPPESVESSLPAIRGPAPTPEQANAAILQTLGTVLKDADSLKQFRIVSGPRSIHWYTGLLAGNRYDAAWMYCFEYNAKNSYGGYVGVQMERVALRVEGGEAHVVPANWGLIDSACP